MAVNITRAIVGFALLVFCGVWIPLKRGWEALDPYLLCAYALAGALFAANAPFRLVGAWLFGAAASFLVLILAIGTVNWTSAAPKLLVPSREVLFQLAVVSLSAPLVAAALARVVRPVPLRLLMLAGAWLFIRQPAHEALGSVARWLPVGAAGAVLIARKYGRK
ncbi:MAG: hypothetical protein FJW39_06990 [Acidobacteria bacterium]|nr:hypothetical protein [Acidobacteriota bacterium]